MTVYVGSLKFSPVFKSHCCAFGKACEKEGYEVKYLFSHEYEWMLSQEIKEKTTFIGHSVNLFSMLKDTSSLKNKEKIKKIFQKEKPSHFYMHNYHFLNHYIAKLSKKFGCSFVYHMHEPFVQNKKAHGGIHQYWLFLFEYFHGRILQNTDVVVLSSREAIRLFTLRYPHYSGKKMLVPLIYEDLGGSEPIVQNRTYVTFVGPPVPAKNPEKFLQIVKYSNAQNIGLKFLLISRSKVNDARFICEKNLEIFCKERISDEEFGKLIMNSIAVITPYRRETQSSVILVSYMYGTPVVSSNVGGLPEFVFHKKTGYLLDICSNADEWINGITYVQKNFFTLSKDCRKYFVENFSEKNWKKYLDDLLA